MGGTKELARRLPGGAECQCGECGVFFSSESAFEKHWTKDGHKSAREVGLVERMNARGPVWGWPGDARDWSRGITGAAGEGSGRAVEPRGEAGGGSYSPGVIAGIPGAPRGAGTDGPARGPGGGVLARCEACGRDWERPRRRGRPAKVCEECK